MRVIVNPGMASVTEMELSLAVQVSSAYVDPSEPFDVWRYAQQVAEQNANLIELLVEKGVLSLADCLALGAPPMAAAR